MGTHLPTTEWCHAHSITLSVGQREGDGKDRQTKHGKVWGHAPGQHLMAWHGCVCVSIPEPRNPWPHSAPPARLRESWAQPLTPSVSVSQLGAPHCAGAGVEGWPSSSSRVAVGHPVWDGDPHRSPSASPWAPRRVSEEP
ncbi:cysteine-rich tail protein 1, partial [Columba livia]